MKVLFHDHSTKLETVSDLEKRPRGGMVGSLFKVSDYLASRGHEVYVSSDIETTGTTKAGVRWVRECGHEVDALVLNRGVHDGYPDIRARSRFLWTHDLPHNGFIPDPKTVRAVACTVFMSRYAERVWRKFYPDIGRSQTIPNGVDRGLFYPRDKDYDYLIYCSAPNRGLNKLPLILDAIRSRTGRDVRLDAYSRLSVLHPNEGKDEFDYAEVGASSVNLCDPIPQKELAERLGRAGLMILPTNYPEICSNTILQSLASATPIITTGNIGSAGEWVRHRKNGMLTEFQPHDYMVYTLEMVRNAIKVLENEKLHKRMIRRAANTHIYSWAEIGRSWERMLDRYT